MPDGAYRDPKRSFALVPPAGWQLSTREQCASVLELRWELRGTCIVAEVVAPVSAEGLPAVVQVGTSPVRGLRVAARTAPGYADEMVRAVAKHLQRYDVERRGLERLDDLAAVGFLGRGVWRSPVPAWGRTGPRALTWARPSYDLVVGGVLVPAADGAFFVRAGRRRANPPRAGGRRAALGPSGCSPARARSRRTGGASAALRAT